MLKLRTQTWRNLPLYPIGKINLLKTKFLPLFLYIFRNSAVWIPQNIFQSIDRVITDFLWGGGTPRIRLQVLQHPWKEGGLAVPNFVRYFLAGQLVFAHRWLNQPEDNAEVTLEAAVVGSYEALSDLLYRGRGVPYPMTGSMHSVIRAWELTRRGALQERVVSPYTPLWRNPSLPHFFVYSDPIIWTRYGIKTVGAVVGNRVLLLFDVLRSKYQLPSSHQFHFLLFRHAFLAQFGS